MSKLGIIALGVVAAVGIGLARELPARPDEPPDPRPGVAAPRPSTAGTADDTTGHTPTDPARSGAGRTTPARPPIRFPVRGTGRYAVLPGHPATLGRSGGLRQFRVVVEGGIANLDHDELGRFVRATYADPRGWTAGGKWRFQHVGPGEAYDFTLMLVTPATRIDLCGGGSGYTSCRMGDQVVLNVARWVHGVPNYGASLETYRQYMINHESGHRLGYAHELCPAPGAPAPVMQQQTLGLHGCTANAWPYLGGERHRGRYGEYDDPVPRS